MLRRRGRAPLWLRLAFSFVAVGVAGVALLAGLTLASTNAQVASLRLGQRRETTAAVVASAAMAYGNAGGWIHADLESAVALAGEAGASVAVFDANQRLVARGLRPTTGSQEGLARSPKTGGPQPKRRPGRSSPHP